MNHALCFVGLVYVKTVHSDVRIEWCVACARRCRDRYGEYEVMRFVEQRKSYYGWKYQDLIKTGYNGLYKVAE